MGAVTGLKAARARGAQKQVIVEERKNVIVLLITAKKWV